MEKKDTPELRQTIKALGHWFHDIDLGNGLTTAFDQQSLTYNPEDRWNLIQQYIPKDLSGKTVLDLGANSGYFSIKMAQRGASSVVSVEASPVCVYQAKFLSEWFNVNLEIVHADVHEFCLTSEERFDYILFLGTFYHLKYGTLALDRLAEMTKERMYFQTATMGPEIQSFNPSENYSNADWGKEVTSIPEFPKMYFIEKKYNADFTNWWLPNDSCIDGLLRSSGHRIIARPNRMIRITEPETYFGKKIFPKLVLPKYGKKDHYVAVMESNLEVNDKTFDELMETPPNRWEKV